MAQTYTPTREDAAAFLGGLLLMIGLFVFPWHHYGLFGFTLDRAATESPEAIWGILAVVLLILMLLELALARLAPQTELPTTQYGRDMTRVGVCAVIDLLLLIKFLVNVGSFGWGFFVDVVLAVIVSGAIWLIAQGRATPLTMASGSR